MGTNMYILMFMHQKSVKILIISFNLFSVMAIYPSANMQDPANLKNNRMSVLFTQAKRMEVMMFHQASSRVCSFR